MLAKSRVWDSRLIRRIVAAGALVTLPQGDRGQWLQEMSIRVFRGGGDVGSGGERLYCQRPARLSVKTAGIRLLESNNIGK